MRYNNSMGEIKTEQVITKSFDFGITEASDIDTGEIEFWCSAKSYDKVNDRVLGIEPIGTVELLYGHNTKDINQWIGSVEYMKYDGDKLYSKAKFNNSPNGQLARQLLKEGAKGKFSISFIPKLYVKNNEGGYDFETVEITEVSLVPTPCHPDTGVVSVKELEIKTEPKSIVDTRERDRQELIKILMISNADEVRRMVLDKLIKGE